jgi:hypothetical protein
MATGPVLIEWDLEQVRRFIDDPNGELGITLMTALGETVLKGAQKRALRRTGRMAREMRYEVGNDGVSVYTDVISPAQDPRSHNFPYPIVHEGKKVRDRRPHRSLRPALRDIRQILREA